MGLSMQTARKQQSQHICHAASLHDTRRSQDEQVQAFIRDGVILIPPDLPEWYHAHIHRRCKELGMDGSGLNPGSVKNISLIARQQ